MGMLGKEERKEQKNIAFKTIITGNIAFKLTSETKPQNWVTQRIPGRINAKKDPQKTYTSFSNYRKS